mgnify:CR=1 FL=1
MLRYEIKKVFSKSKNRIAVIVLFVILVITSILTINKVEFVDENGNSASSGKVESMSPSGGGKVSPSTEIILYVSLTSSLRAF